MTDDKERYIFDERIKTIAIIGAGKVDLFDILNLGSTGIVLAKAALSEGFTSIRIFEQRGDIGGAWSHRPSEST